MDSLQQIPISNLSSALEATETKAIRGIVTLLWPYSSSTRKAALLLAEPDYRLRRSKGQVRVELRDASAEAVAKSKIGIGDEVILALLGAQWVDNTRFEEVVHTPGKSVDWNLRFGHTLQLQAFRGEEVYAVLDIYSSTPTPRTSPWHIHSDSSHAPATPLQDGLESGSQRSVLFRRSRITSEGLTYSPYDPFEGDNNRPNKRVRTSWHGVGAWRLSSRTPSPEKQDKISSLEGTSPSHIIGKNHVDMDDFVNTNVDVQGDHRSPTLSIISLPKDDQVEITPPNNVSRAEQTTTINIISADVQPSLQRFEVYRDREQDRIIEPAGLDLITHFAADNSIRNNSDQDSNILVDESIDELFGMPQPLPNIDSENIFGPGGEPKPNPPIETSPHLLTSSKNAEGYHSDLLSGSKSLAHPLHQPVRVDHDEDVFGNSRPHQSATESSFSLMPPPSLPQSDGGNAMVLESPAMLPAIPETTQSHHSSPDLKGFSSSPSLVPRRGSRRDMPSTHQKRSRSGSVIQKEGALQIPATADRKHRSSSTSSRRSGNGPFGDNFRARAPFGITGALEEAVIDGSPDIAAEDLQRPENISTEGQAGLLELVLEKNILPQPAVPLPPFGMHDVGEAANVLHLQQERLQPNFRDVHDIETVQPRAQNDDGNIDSRPLFLDGAYDYADSYVANEQRRNDDDTEQQPLFLNDAYDSMDNNTANKYWSRGSFQHMPKRGQIDANELAKARLSEHEEQEYPKESPIDQEEDNVFHPPSDEVTVKAQLQSEPPSIPSRHISNLSSRHSNVSSRHKLLNGFQSNGQVVLLPENYVSQTEALEQESSSQQTSDDSVVQSDLLNAQSQIHNRESTLASPPQTQEKSGEADFRITTTQLLQPGLLIPLTPSATQPSATQAEDDLLGNSPSTALRPSSSQESAVNKHKRQSSASIFPEALRTWFTPNRASLESANAITIPNATNSEGNASELALTQSDAELPQGSDFRIIAQAQAKLHMMVSQAVEPLSDRVKISSGPVEGLRTSLSYYTPLHPQRLRPLLNTASSQDSLIDIIAVVTSCPKTATRAAKGPRDWNTNFHIADQHSWRLRTVDESEWPRGDVLVQCFVGGTNGNDMLPEAEVGDVILLTGFAVTSRKGTVGLINRGPGSGWCVWRYDANKSEVPDVETQTVEEIKGAPVEISQEERRFVYKLREWWITRTKD